MGGRPIRKIIQNEIEVEIAKFIIYNKDCDSVTIDYLNNKFCCNVPSRKKKIELITVVNFFIVALMPQAITSTIKPKKIQTAV